MQDPFDPDEFVERLAWRTTGGVSRTKAEDFDPMVLHSAFEKTIKSLKDMNVTVQKNIERLEGGCKDEEKVHWLKVTELQKHNQVHIPAYLFLMFKGHTPFFTRSTSSTCK